MTAPSKTDTGIKRCDAVCLANEYREQIERLQALLDAETLKREQVEQTLARVEQQMRHYRNVADIRCDDTGQRVEVCPCMYCAEGRVLDAAIAQGEQHE